MKDTPEFSEVLEAYRNKYNLWNFEGEHGLDNFTKICQAIGYQEDNFKYGSPIEKFLSDNPGVFDKILEFMEGFNCQEWIENLQDAME